VTLAEHAEAWTRERGEIVPPRDSEAWGAMYEKWIDWAFDPSTLEEGDE